MTRALLVHLWRRGRWHLILLGGGLTVFAALFLSFVRPDDDAHRAELARGVLVIALVCLTIDLVHLVEGRTGRGFDARLFALPVSSRRLAGTWLAALAGTLAMLYGIGGTALELWLSVPGPSLAGALAAAAAMSWLACAMWATPDRPGARTMAIVALVVAVQTVLRALSAPGPSASGVTDTLRDPLAALESAGPVGLAVLLATLAAAFPAGARAVARHRRGDALPAVRGALAGRLRRVAGGAPPAYPFAHASSALLWLDWREKGALVPLLFSAPWLFLATAGMSGMMDRDALLRMTLAFVPWSLLFGPVLVAGIVCLRHGTVGARLDDLRALRPVSSGRLAGVVLVHAVLSLAFGWTLTVIGASIASSLLGVSPGGLLPGSVAAAPDLAGRLAAAALVLAVVGWLQIGMLSALLLTGRATAAAILIVIPYAAGAALLVFRDQISNLPGEAMLAAAPWLVGGLGLAGTATVLALALAKGVVSGRALGWQAATLALAVAVAALRLDLEAGPRTFAGLGFAAAVLAPWPAASLAVRWNRHR